MRNIFYTIGYNTFVQLLGKAISTVIAFISIGLLTRYLGQEGFGNFSLVFVYLSFFGILADLGLQLTMVRDLAKKEYQKKEVYGTYFWLKLTLVFISTFLALIILLFFPYGNLLKLGILVASFGVAIGLFNNFGTVIFQANLRMDLVTLVDVLMKVFYTGAIVFFIYLKLGFLSLLSSVLLGNLVGLFLTFYLLKKFISLEFKFNFSLARKMVRKSLPVGLITFLVALYFKIDTLILSFYRGAAEVGVYSLAYKIIENLLMFWGFYMATVYPLLAGLSDKNKNREVKNLWNKSIQMALILSGFIVFFGYIFAPLAIRVLGGEEFSQSVIALRILLFSVPFFFVNNLFYHSFLVDEQIKKLAIIISISVIVNIFLSLIFIPKWGYRAACVNNLATCFCAFAIYTFYFIKRRPSVITKK